MKKVKTAAALLCSACLVLSGTAVPTMADSVKVVTLGADLTQDQKNTMMKYFNVDSNQVQILTITNQDERDHLSAYVPLEQIGTRTVSCAYVKPTQSGGIKVRTANLNWVTCNMIATSLSTSGVKNCEVVAACPFEVSGTGALTGIQMAYETATGEQLDSTKKELATEEMVVTGNLADEVGKNDATTVMNNSKIQVIKDNVQNVDDIYNIVVNVAQQNNVNLDSDQINKIVELLKQIAQQEYNYDDVKATLEQVEQNTSGDNDELGDIDDEEDDTVNAGDSADGDDILNNVDNSALGGDIVESSTENPSLEEDSGLIEDDGDDQSDGDLSETEEPQEPDGDETTDDSTLGNTDEGDTLRPLGYIDSDFIYGMAHKDDIISGADGSRTYAMYRVGIIDVDYNLIKEYEQPDIYVSSTEVQGKRITLSRIVKSGSGYVSTSIDQLINKDENVIENAVKAETISTDARKQELYIDLITKVNDISVTYRTSGEIIFKDNTKLELEDDFSWNGRYYVYGYGKFQGSRTQLESAITLAYDTYGTVVDSNSKLVWKRYRSTQASIDGIVPVTSGDSIVNAVVAVSNYLGADFNAVSYMEQGHTAVETFDNIRGVHGISLTGITYEKALSYVGDGSPVIARIGEDEYIIITAYNSSEIAYIEASTGAQKTASMNEAGKMFSQGGNIYVTYYK